MRYSIIRISAGLYAVLEGQARVYTGSFQECRQKLVQLVKEA